MLETVTTQFRNSAAMRWYQGRDAQERPIIAGLAALILLALLWLLIWNPLAQWQETSQNRYVNAQTTWDWIQANESKARQLASSKAGSGQQRSLLPIITRVANSHSLTLNRLQPESDGGVSVVIQAQSFNAMLQWLDELQRQHNVSIQRVSLDAEGNPGLVNAQLRLQ
jgi:general secretion pathway protein M